MLGLPSSFLLLSSSFLLAFSLLFFLFRGVFQISYVCMCWSREVERKRENYALFLLASPNGFLSLFLLFFWPSKALRGGKWFVLFSFCLVLLQSSMHNKCTFCLFSYSKLSAITPTHIRKLKNTSK